MVARLSVVARPPGVGVCVDGGAEPGVGGEVGAADGAAVGACVGTCIDEIGCTGVQVRDTVGGGSAGAGSSIK